MRRLQAASMLEYMAQTRSPALRDGALEAQTGRGVNLAGRIIVTPLTRSSSREVRIRVHFFL